MTIYEIYKKTKQGKERITTTDSLIEVEEIKGKFKNKVIIEEWHLQGNIPHLMGEI
jgi:hypothetical protein